MDNNCYKNIYNSTEQIVGIALWYNNGIKNNPALIFATGRHGKNDNKSYPFIMYSLDNKINYIYDKNDNIISGYFSSISIDKNLILFGGNSLKKSKNIETSKLYFISPKTKKCKLIFNFVDEIKYHFTARTCIIKNKQIIIGGTNKIIMIQ